MSHAPVSFGKRSNRDSAFRLIDFSQQVARKGLAENRRAASRAFQIPEDEHLAAALEIVSENTGSTTASDTIRDAIRLVASVVYCIDVPTGRDRRTRKRVMIRLPDGSTSELDMQFDPQKVRPERVEGRIKLYAKPTQGFTQDLSTIIHAFSARESEINLLISFAVQLCAGFFRLRDDGAVFENADVLNALFRVPR